MENKLRRPASVWIAQILMIVGALFFLSPLVMLLFLPGGVGIGSIVGFILMIGIFLGMVTLFLIAFWGMARRRLSGRWLGVGMLSLLVFFSIVGQIVQTSGPLGRWEYENSTQAMAGFMTQLIVLGLLVWLILALAFGKRATAFFAGTDPGVRRQSLP